MSQTDPSILNKISAHRFLIWGESGILENNWIQSNSNFIIDKDLQSIGGWLIGTYAWAISMCIIFICLFIYCFRCCCCAGHSGYTGLKHEDTVTPDVES